MNNESIRYVLKGYILLYLITVAFLMTLLFPFFIVLVNIRNNHLCINFKRRITFSLFIFGYLFISMWLFILSLEVIYIYLIIISLFLVIVYFAFLDRNSY